MRKTYCHEFIWSENSFARAHKCKLCVVKMVVCMYIRTYVCMYPCAFYALCAFYVRWFIFRSREPLQKVCSSSSVHIHICRYTALSHSAYFHTCMLGRLSTSVTCLFCTCLSAFLSALERACLHAPIRLRVCICHMADHCTGEHTYDNSWSSAMPWFTRTWHSIWPDLVRGDAVYQMIDKSNPSSSLLADAWDWSSARWKWLTKKWWIGLKE
jgi:hypothetical protein